MEVIVSNNVIELPPAHITGGSPLSDRFFIKFVGGGGGGEALAVSNGNFIIRNPSGYWQAYTYVGAGYGGGAPISWADRLPRGSGWVEFRTTEFYDVGHFVGLAAVNEAGAQIGDAGVSLYMLTLPDVNRKLSLATGSGFAFSGAETIGRISRIGPIHHNGRWDI